MRGIHLGGTEVETERGAGQIQGLPVDGGKLDSQITLLSSHVERTAYIDAAERLSASGKSKGQLPQLRRREITVKRRAHPLEFAKRPRRVTDSKAQIAARIFRLQFIRETKLKSASQAGLQGSARRVGARSTTGLVQFHITSQPQSARATITQVGQGDVDVLQLDGVALPASPHLDVTHRRIGQPELLQKNLRHGALLGGIRDCWRRRSR